jgi:hypothetical protein
MNSRLPPETAGGPYPPPTESSGIFVGERVLSPPPAEQTLEEEAPVVFSKTLRLWLTELAVPAPVAALSGAPAAAPATASAPASAAADMQRKAQAGDAAFSDAIMAWMRQGDRLSESARSSEPVDPPAGLDANDAAPTKRRPAGTPAQLLARRVRQSVVVVAAAAGIWAAIAWSSRPHIVRADDGPSYAGANANVQRGPAAGAAPVRAVRADAPGAFLASPSPAPVAPASPATGPAQPGVMAVEVPTANAPAAPTKRHQKPVTKRHGRGAHR